MIAPDKLSQIAPSLRAGQYSLLLGAGVSLDSQNGAGLRLPRTDEFRLDLCRLKGARESSTLQRVFATLTPNEIEEHVVKRFKNCSPGPSVQKLTKFLWRRIYTFNIDDTLQGAYGANGTIQKSQTIHFSDPYTEPQDLTEVPIIHLHGWVGAPNRGFVFANPEYVRQIKTINPWMVLLTQLLPSDPFIICGASLDEIDLEYYLAHRSQATSRADRGPSILVEPFPDSVTARDCDRYGLLLFKGTAVEFWDYLNRTIPDRPAPFDLTPPSIQSIFPRGTAQRTIISFSADFEIVPQNADKNRSPSRFLFGHPPSWEDLAGGLDVSRETTASVSSEIDNRLSGADPNHVVIVFDETGTGKSTIVRRIAYEFAQRTVKVLTCSALSRIDPQLTAEAIDLIDGPVLVVVDNFADQASAIADLLGRLQKKDVAVLGAERNYRAPYLARVLSEVRYKMIGGLELHFVEAERLLNLFLQLGLVGTADAAKNPNHFAKQIFREPIAVAACRILNDFRPLDRIVRSIIADTAEIDRKRYYIAALAHFCIRGGVRHEILASISGPSGWDAQFASRHPMPLTYFDGGDKSYVVPLNAALAARVLERLAKDNPALLLETFVALGNAIAPRVNRGAIRRRSPEARLASRLFDFDQVVTGFLGDLAPQLYIATHDAWRWNSRYWEQVALMKLAKFHSMPSSDDGLDALEEAVQHARHAVSIETHPLSLTTLAKVLLAQIGVEGISNTAVYAEAFARLIAAIEYERSWSSRTVHAFMSLFRGTRDFLARGGILLATQRETVERLLEEAQRLFPRNPDIAEAASSLLRQLKQ